MGEIGEFVERTKLRFDALVPHSEGVTGCCEGEAECNVMLVMCETQTFPGVTYISLAGLGFTTFSVLKLASMISLKPAFPTFLASCGAHTDTRTHRHTRVE